MTRFYLTVAFATASLAGLALILHAVLAGPRDREGERPVELGFSCLGSEKSAPILDLDMGHEGLKHRKKELFDPGRYKPEKLRGMGE